MSNILSLVSYSQCVGVNGTGELPHPSAAQERNAFGLDQNVWLIASRDAIEI